MEQIIFYILMFCTGCMFGSFFTLAIHRIPLHQDITHKRSYCPNCNHKLSFFDMIPVLSYILLGGKCRYCKKKIRVRYICLEILTGIVFLLFTMSLNINLNSINISKIVYKSFRKRFNFFTFRCIISVYKHICKNICLHKCRKFTAGKSVCRTFGKPA